MNNRISRWIMRDLVTMKSSDVDITNLHIRTISIIARRHLLYHCMLSVIDEQVFQSQSSHFGLCRECSSQSIFEYGAVHQLGGFMVLEFWKALQSRREMDALRRRCPLSAIFGLLSLIVSDGF